uniref:Elongator complex protein 5 n=1 Tax=Globodera pallida TaxID=36090 RepID=A0A183BWY0_GLOPA
MDISRLQRICAVYASEGINGYPFSLALIRKALDAKLNVYALLFLHLRRDLPAAFKDNPRFITLECFDDADSFERIRERLAQQNITRDSMLFVDSLRVLIEQFSLPSTSWFLTQMAELSASVLALMHGSEDDEDWRGIESIATTVFELMPRDKLILCRTATKKKNGTAEVKLEQYSIEEDYSLTFSPVNFDRNRTVDGPGENALPPTGSVGPTAALGALPFDLGLNLSEEERNAKARVPLPYLDAQTEKGLVGLNISSNKKVWVGGRILYMPDKEDDFDESDPDDDLTV